jgi:hypothetical protein
MRVIVEMSFFLDIRTFSRNKPPIETPLLSAFRERKK